MGLRPGPSLRPGLIFRRETSLGRGTAFCPDGEKIRGPTNRRRSDLLPLPFLLLPFLDC